MHRAVVLHGREADPAFHSDALQRQVHESPRFSVKVADLEAPFAEFRVPADTGELMDGHHEYLTYGKADRFRTYPTAAQRRQTSPLFGGQCSTLSSRSVVTTASTTEY